ncbi:hypothetical protein M3Y94_00570600 [Aphelenchoides besseyi]|nr:hypothetical protein M3Y94_00570600 [Aphelenchoides besseyi]
MPLIADIVRSRQAIHTVAFGHDFFARDFFRRQPAFVSSLLSSKNLRQLIVLSNQLLLPSVANVITPLHIQRIRSSCLQVIVLQNVLLDVNTLRCLAERYSTTCHELRIGGVLCDSAKAISYWQEIERFCFVKTLEIPSSIFVINSQSLRSDVAKPLKKLVHLKKLCVAVATVELRDIQRFILDCLPECLEKLVLYHLLSTTHFQINVPKNRKLLVEQHGQAVSYSLTASWMHKITSLAYKTMWLPPYFPAQDNLSINVTSIMYRAQRRNQEFLNFPVVSDEDDEPSVSSSKAVSTKECETVNTNSSTSSSCSCSNSCTCLDLTSSNSSSDNSIYHIN